MDQAVTVSQIQNALQDLAILFPALSPWGQTRVRAALAELNAAVASAGQKDMS